MPDREQLTAFVRKCATQEMAGTTDPVFVIESIRPEASTRRYYRVQFADPKRAASFVLCAGPPIPEPPADDFLSISKFLHARQIPVPEIVGIDAEQGLILQSDGGRRDLHDLLKELLQQRAAARGPERKPTPEMDRAIEEQLFPALDVLARIHEQPAPDPVRSRFFDKEKLLWEMEFLKSKLETRCEKLSITSPFTFEFEMFLQELCARLGAAEPRVFTHRDFHGKNILMRDGGGICVIDYQDARMGTPWYDLSSLLFDPYVQLPIPFVEYGYQTYLEITKTKTPGARNLFFAQALQRIYKALGSFIFLAFERNHDGYFRYIEPALERAEMATQLGGFPDSSFIFINRFRVEILPALAEERRRNQAKQAGSGE